MINEKSSSSKCLISRECLEKIHLDFQDACIKANCLLDILDNFIKSIESIVSEKQEECTDIFKQNDELRAIQEFKNGLTQSLAARKNTFKDINILNVTAIVVIAITIFINSKKDIEDDQFTLFIMARYKSLASELKKLLRNAASGKQSDLTDRMAFKIVIDDSNVTESVAIEKLNFLNNTITGIITDSNQILRVAFIQWVESTKMLDEGSKSTILAFLNDFKMLYDKEKNYVDNPKSNGYRARHCTFHIVSSTVDTFVEMQIVTKNMYDFNERGNETNHSQYEEYRDGDTIDIISLDDKSIPNIHIFGLDFDKSGVKEDNIGIFNCRRLVNRYISPKAISFHSSD